MLNQKKRGLITPNCTSCKTCFFESVIPGYLNRTSNGFYPRGSSLFMEGDRLPGVFVICRGLVGIYKSVPNGMEILTRIHSEGDICGYRSVLANEPASASCKSLIDTCVRIIPRTVLDIILEKHPFFIRKILEKVCQDLKMVEDALMKVRFDSVSKRILNFFSIFRDSQAKGKEGVGPRYIDLPFPYHMLADIVGTTPETISRSLKKLKESGVIKLQGKYRIIFLKPIS